MDDKRITSRLLLSLALLILSGKTAAQHQYCATRYMPTQQSECFDNRSEAENYIRTEPFEFRGNAFLEPHSYAPYGNGGSTERGWYCSGRWR